MMKKLIILFFISSTALAQTQKGALSIGTGSINYKGYIEKDGLDYSAVTINPGVGYLVLKNTELGAGLQYVNVWSKSSKNHSIIFTPYITQYFGRKRFQPFVQAKAGVVTVKYDAFVSQAPLRGFTWEVSVGGMYFLNKNLALGFSAGYRDRHQTSEKPITGEYIFTVKEIFSGVNFNVYFPLKKEKSN